MTAIRHTLQRDVFLPHDERLIAVVHVTKAGKKKKVSFLCVVVTTDQPAQVSIHKVKKVDKDNYKKRQSWLLSELKIVDGKAPDVDVPDFDLHFEKAYKWLASNVAEKNSFIASLWKLTQRYLKQLNKPDFINVKPSLMEEFVSLEDQSRGLSQPEDGLSSSDDYQALSPREEKDLERMMNECEFAIGNAEAFVEQLANDLSVLDGANIHSIIESQQEVARLMHVLDEGLREVGSLEESLDNYDKKLEGVRVHMEIMEQKDSMIQIQSQNHAKLTKELKDAMKKLDIPHQYQMALLDRGDLGSPKGIMECTSAAECLQEKMETKVHTGLSKMRAITDQQELLTNLQEKFAQRLATHLNSMFIQQGMGMGETGSGSIALPKHHSFHRDLIPYSELIQWLKKADNTSFKKLSKIYTESLHRLYERELADFFEIARQALIGPKGGKAAEGKVKPDRKISDAGIRGPKGKVPTMHDLVTTFKGGESDLSDHQRFDMVFTSMLNEIEPMCQAEQDFCSKFFGLGVEPDLLPTQVAQGNSQDFLGEEFSATEMDGNLFSAKNKKPEETKQVKSELSLACKRQIRAVMSDLFGSLETEMKNFTVFAERVDNFNSVYMLVRIGHQVLSQSSQAGSYLSMVLANCLVEVKRNFDKYIDNMVRSMEETRMSKKQKCGILPFVKEFEKVAEEAEMVFKGSERRGDLDKAYTKLVSAQFKGIHRIALEHQKTPRDVVMFENFHHLHAVLYRLKITVLENERKEAKQKYTEHLQLYVQESLGRPMDKLNSFFEGVQTLVAQGVKEEEVGYQMAFNKQELRKVIQQYPGKEVKKGLDGLCKKVEKTLCEEENLFQVTWRSFQEEFIRQYKQIEGLIARCYPGANVKLEFSINEVLQYFSEIAQSH
ncbi:LOW QUALITY PROTEIN: exocyst complex component 1-like [Amphiura filiformis]|uniref:LOW QUALITY PROTEIN: exocyst complex component 1-like n=1 Tax=Amphiura filiformis TaxID=82378 RepID=UPI003B228B42